MVSLSHLACIRLMMASSRQCHKIEAAAVRIRILCNLVNVLDVGQQQARLLASVSVGKVSNPKAWHRTPLSAMAHSFACRKDALMEAMVVMQD